MKEVLTKMKKPLKMHPKMLYLKLKRMKRYKILLKGFLAQLNAGNNSEIIKNEIRQLLYSFYRSKKLTKNIYKSLFETLKIIRQMSLTNLLISLVTNLISKTQTRKTLGCLI